MMSEEEAVAMTSEEEVAEKKWQQQVKKKQQRLINQSVKCHGYVTAFLQCPPQVWHNVVMSHLWQLNFPLSPTLPIHLTRVHYHPTGNYTGPHLWPRAIPTTASFLCSPEPGLCEELNHKPVADVCLVPLQYDAIIASWRVLEQQFSRYTSS